MNNYCVFFKEVILPVPVNDSEEIQRFVTGRPKKIGDDAIIVIKVSNKDSIDSFKQRNVRLLMSHEMVKDRKYLVDLKNEDCWKYDP